MRSSQYCGAKVRMWYRGIKRRGPADQFLVQARLLLLG